MGFRIATQIMHNHCSFAVSRTDLLFMHFSPFLHFFPLFFQLILKTVIGLVKLLVWVFLVQHTWPANDQSDMLWWLLEASLQVNWSSSCYIMAVHFKKSAKNGREGSHGVVKVFRSMMQMKWVDQVSNLSAVWTWDLNGQASVTSRITQPLLMTTPIPVLGSAHSTANTSYFRATLLVDRTLYHDKL